MNIVTPKLRFQNVFGPHENAKPAVFKFFGFEERFRKVPFSWRIGVDGRPNCKIGLMGVFEKLRFLDGLVWPVGLTVEIKLRFWIPQASVDEWFEGFWKSQRSESISEAIEALLRIKRALNVDFKQAWTCSAIHHSLEGCPPQQIAVENYKKMSLLKLESYPYPAPDSYLFLIHISSGCNFPVEHYKTVS